MRFGAGRRSRGGVALGRSRLLRLRGCRFLLLVGLRGLGRVGAVRRTSAGECGASGFATAGSSAPLNSGFSSPSAENRRRSWILKPLELSSSDGICLDHLCARHVLEAPDALFERRMG